MASQTCLFKARHKVLGVCEVVRMEGVDWIVRQEGNLIEYRFQPHRRHEFTFILETESDAKPVGVILTGECPPTTTVDLPTDAADLTTGTLPSDPAEPVGVAPPEPPPVTMLPPVPAAIAPTVPSLDDPRVLKRIMRSLRDGLPPTHTNMRQFAVGIRRFDMLNRAIFA